MNLDTPRRLATLYAKFLDDRDFDRLDEIMTRDVVIAAPQFECVGLAAFRDQLQMLHDYSRTMHLIGNQYGEWDGDAYRGETYCVATHIHEKDGVGRKWEVGIRYRDTIAKSGEDHKYTRRYLDVVWQSDTALSD